MMRGMYSAISGLRNHQIMLDVTANDLANVNTVGFKASRTSFRDSLAQMQRSGASATTGSAGAKSAQIGLGVQLGSIDNNMSTGALQTTGNPLDVALQSDVHSVVDLPRDPEGAREVPAGPARDDRDLRLSPEPGEAVRHLVHRAVAADHDEELRPVERRFAGELGEMSLPLAEERRSLEPGCRSASR